MVRIGYFRRDEYLAVIKTILTFIAKTSTSRENK